jgi:hypothetical protein
MAWAGPSSAPTVVHRSCPICEASCGLRLEVDRAEQRVLSVRGDEGRIDVPSGTGVANGIPVEVLAAWPQCRVYPALRLVLIRHSDQG